jgi:epoxyqueuosine reductase
MKQFTDIIKSYGAAEVGAIPYRECTVINTKLAERLAFTPKTVFIGIVPYYTHFCDGGRTVSAYALAHDYHKHLHSICIGAVNKLKECFPTASFEGFADHSPINEKLAAAKAGLGIIGDHSLLITERYSSFVFLFEIITDLEFDLNVSDIRYCGHCGACKKACPADINDKKTCLSAITQKKGELTQSESDLIKGNGYIWGCDICQLACPHTQRAISTKDIYTDSTWFNSNIIAFPNEQTVADSDDFLMRAYSWRGKQTILRNISLLDN